MTTEIRETSVRTRENAARPFPSNFLFGAATAAYQIEGAALEGGRRDSIWDAFSRVPGAVINADNGDVACDHYNLYRDDVALMKSMGLQTYRFSTSWSRVRPDGGALNLEGVDFYKRLVDELLDAGILPWLTLYHWDLPQALQERGGWAVRDTADRFTEYALDMHDALGDRVNVWTTLNEPWCSSFLSYTAGLHAPGHYSKSEGMLAAHHLMLGHGQAVRELRARDASLNLGITLNLTVADPVDPADPVDLDAARRIDGQFNRWFLDPIFRAQYPQDIFDEIADDALRAAILPGDLEVISTPIDTLGVNYYHGEFVGGHAPGGPADRAATRPPTGAASRRSPRRRASSGTSGACRARPCSWEVQPEGLTRLLVRVSEEYAAPAGTSLFVTENGAAYDDEPVVEGGVVRVHDDRARRLRAPPPGRDPRRGRCRRRRPRILLLVAARQLRVGMGVREAVRYRASRLRHAGALDQGQRPRVRPHHRGARARREHRDGRDRVVAPAEGHGMVSETGTHTIAAAATIEEVAAAAGVSRSTVSRVVNGSTAVSPSALESVKRAIAELNYVPNRAARSLASRQTHAIALVVPEDTTRFFGDPFFAAIVSGINARISRSDYVLNLFIASDDPGDKTTSYVRSGSVDGAIIVSHHTSDLFIDRIAAAVPVVYGGRPVRERERDYYVDVDNVRGGREATDLS